MKGIKAYAFVVVLLANTSSAQVEAAPVQNQKFADALQDQVSCGQKPEPAKAIRALQKEGIVSNKPYNIVDSVSFFRLQKPLNVLGFKVYAVSAFDYDS